MRNEFRQQGNKFFDIETGHCAGFVAPLKNGKGFSVHRAMTDGYERNRVAVVKSIADALPALTTYYDENPPRWKRTRDSQFDWVAGYTMYTAFVKWSFYGFFRAKQREDGKWIVTRYSDAPLLYKGDLAAFPTAELAKHVADLHERDGFVDFLAINDGYFWDGRPFLGPGAYQTLPPSAGVEMSPPHPAQR
jgi:hypothetical protein